MAGVAVLALVRRWWRQPKGNMPAVPGMFLGWLLTSLIPLAIIKASIVGVVRLLHEAPAMGFLF